MLDLLQGLDKATRRFLMGHPREASELGKKLLNPSRATPHGPTVYRHQAEFLLASGDYDSARQVAVEAGNLARATKHPSEILAATLAILACDMYQGQIATVFQQLLQLQSLAPQHPMPQGALARLQLLVGEFESGLELCEKTRTLIDEDTSTTGPLKELARARLLEMESEALLAMSRPQEAKKRIERVLLCDLPSPIPHVHAQAMFGLSLAKEGVADKAAEYCATAITMGKKISNDMHGHALCTGGIMNLTLGKLQNAIEHLRLSSALLLHPLDRQKTFFHLGRAYQGLGMIEDALTAFERALQPSGETYHGRNAIQKLHKMVGLTVV